MTTEEEVEKGVIKQKKKESRKMHWDQKSKQKMKLISAKAGVLKLILQ